MECSVVLIVTRYKLFVIKFSAHIPRENGIPVSIDKDMLNIIEFNTYTLGGNRIVEISITTWRKLYVIELNANILRDNRILVSIDHGKK
jgi:hypothetical protein